MLIADREIIYNCICKKSDLDDLMLNRDQICLSVITYLRILEESGNKGGIGKKIPDPPFRILHIRDEISFRAVCLYRMYNPTGTFSMENAFIAATALYYGLPIFTAQPEIYRHIPGIAFYSAKQGHLTNSKSIKSA